MQEVLTIMEVTMYVLFFWKVANFGGRVYFGGTLTKP